MKVQVQKNGLTVELSFRTVVFITVAVIELVRNVF